MELDLNHLVLTFVLGSTALLLLRGFLCIVGLDPAAFFTVARAPGKRRRGEPSILFSAGAIAVAVALGLVLENTAKWATWRMDLGDSFEAAFVAPFSNDRNLRRKALLATKDSGKGEFYPGPLLAQVLSTHPGKDQAEKSRERLSKLLDCQSVDWQLRDMSTDLAIQTPQSRGQRAEHCRSVLPPGPCYADFYHTTPGTRKWPDQIACVMVAAEPVRNRLPLAVNDLYYFAKNEVFRDEQYSDELRLIEDRENFARAFALLCALGLVVGIPFGGVAVWRLWQSRSGKDVVRVRATARFWIALALFGVLSLGYFAAATAYAEEANELYIRVFGYYVTLSQ